MRGYNVTIALLLSVLALGGASAAPVGAWLEPPDRRAGAAAEETETAPHFIEEYCPPWPLYRYVCVGPYEVDSVRVKFGRTGAFAWSNNTTAIGFLDTDRVQVYGPYIVDMPVGDDVRVCYFECQLPYPLYAKVHQNIVLHVWLLGGPVAQRQAEVHVVVGSEEGLPLPPPFGCDRWQSQCE